MSYVVFLKHDRNKNHETGFLVFGNEFDEKLRHLNNAIPCFRKCWRYDEVVEHLTDQMKGKASPKTIKQIAAFMTLDDIQPCWLYVKPNVQLDSPFLRDYERMKHLIMRIKSREGVLSIGQNHQLSSKEMNVFHILASSTIASTVSWRRDMR